MILVSQVKKRECEKENMNELLLFCCSILVSLLCFSGSIFCICLLRCRLDRTEKEVIFWREFFSSVEIITRIDDPKYVRFESKEEEKKIQTARQEETTTNELALLFPFQDPSQWPTGWRYDLLMYLSAPSSEGNSTPMAWLKMGQVCVAWRQCMFDHLPRLPEEDLFRFAECHQLSSLPLTVLQHQQKRVLEFRKEWLREHLQLRNSFKRLRFLDLGPLLVNDVMDATWTWCFPQVLGYRAAEPPFLSSSHTEPLKMEWLMIIASKNDTLSLNEINPSWRFKKCDQWLDAMASHPQCFCNLRFIDFRHCNVSLEKLCVLNQLPNLEGLDLRNSTLIFCPSSPSSPLEDQIATFTWLMKSLPLMRHVRLIQMESTLWSSWEPRLLEATPNISWHQSDDHLPPDLWSPPGLKLRHRSSQI